MRPRLRPRPNDFASRPHGPRCLNIPGCYRRSVDCVCVCLLDTTARPTKTDGPIGMLFELWTRVGPGNHVFCGGRNRTRGRGNFRGCFPYSNASCKLYEQQTPGDSASRRAYSYKMDSSDKCGSDAAFRQTSLTARCAGERGEIQHNARRLKHAEETYRGDSAGGSTGPGAESDVNADE